MSDVVPTPSEAQLVERLGALAAAAGSAPRAVKLLADRGVDVSRGELEVLREQHTPLYMALAEERARSIEEGIAQGYREIAVGAQRVTKQFVEKIADDMERGEMPRDMDRTVQAMAKVLQVSTDKLLSITGRPVQGRAGDPMEDLRELEKLGIARVKDRPAIEGSAEEVPDA